MSSILNRIVAIAVISVLPGVLALGKTIEKKVTFTESVTVNGTLVKKGTYKVTFNEETNELTIRQGKKVVATAQARLEKTNERYDFYTRSASDDPTKADALVSISLKDGNLVTISSNADNKITTLRP
jgi:hypothetical protein